MKQFSFDPGRVREFLETPGKRLLFYHRDADGVASAALMLRFFPGFESAPRKGPRMDRDFAEGIVKKGPKLIVFLDLPVDQEERMDDIRKALPGARILIVDHHIFERDMNGGNTVHINPRFREKGVYLPASYLVYNILKKLGKDAEPLMWIACAGVIGDYAFEDCGDFLEEGKKKYPGRYGELCGCADVISSAITLRDLEGAERALELLLKAESCGEFLGNRELREWHETVEDEIRKIMEDFGRNREEHGVLVVYEIKSELSISSVIASALAKKYQDRIILVRRKSGDEWKLSLRYQAGLVNLGDLVKKCVKGIGSGGGHEKASGAVVGDWDEFRKRILSALRKGSC